MLKDGVEMIMHTFYAYPWALVLTVVIPCLVLTLILPIPFEYWETDWTAIGMYIALQLGVTTFLCTSLFPDWKTLATDLIKIAFIFFVVIIVTLIRLVITLSRNYPKFADVFDIEAILKERQKEDNIEVNFAANDDAINQPT